MLSSLEQLRAEKRLQLSVYRILNKALDFYQEDVLPWHRSIEPCLTSLGGSDQEVRGDYRTDQEVRGGYMTDLL
ncbi:hypothetical protein FKM82_027065 [Ascaphus truei]